MGKFMSVDPLTNEYPELTPYQFASNRPIDGIDLDGLEYLSVHEARVGIDGSLTNRFVPFIKIAKQHWPTTRFQLNIIRNSVRSYNDKTLSEYDYYSYLRLKKGNSLFDLNSKGRGEIVKRNPSGGLGLGLFQLLSDAVVGKAKSQIREDMEITKDHLLLLEKSIAIVQNERELKLVPLRFSDYDLIRYVFSSELPESESMNGNEEIINLGNWLFQFKDYLLKGQKPNSESGDIKDLNYPLNHVEEKFSEPKKTKKQWEGIIKV